MSTVTDLATHPLGDLGVAAETTARFVEAFERWERARAEAAGASLPRLRLVYRLHCTGPQKMSELADFLSVTPRNVTALVDGLEGDGYLERTPHPTDRRATLIRLSDAGDVLAQRFDAWAADVRELFGTLEPADQRALARILDQLMVAMAEER